VCSLDAETTLKRPKDQLFAPDQDLSMSNGFHASLSGSGRPSVPHHYQKHSLIEANLLELGLVGHKHQRKNKKKAVEFRSPADHSDGTCSLSN
jgi:hypothetical protein